MTETKTNENRVDPTHDGKFHAFWHGQVVFEKGRVKRFQTENDAWKFLADCDLAGKIIH
jgi:hypothetical protein